MTIKVGINGFGRIGRNVLRSAVQNFAGDIRIVAINDLLEPDYLAYMLRYDSVHGRFKGEVAVDGNTLLVNGTRIRLTQEKDPASLKWGQVGAHVVEPRTTVVDVLHHVAAPFEHAAHHPPRRVVVVDDDIDVGRAGGDLLDCMRRR